MLTVLPQVDHISQPCHPLVTQFSKTAFYQKSDVSRLTLIQHLFTDSFEFLLQVAKEVVNRLRKFCGSVCGRCLLYGRGLSIKLLGYGSGWLDGLPTGWVRFLVLHAKILARERRQTIWALQEDSHCLCLDLRTFLQCIRSTKNAGSREYSTNRCGGVRS